MALILVVVLMADAETVDADQAHPLLCDHAFARPLTPHVIHPNAALPFIRCRSPWCALVRLQSVAWRVYLENAGLRIYSMNTGNFTNPLAEGISAERLFGTV